MARIVLLAGTRKGCFLLESDGDRRDWAVRGPYCESWPVYHAIYDRDGGAIYAAAASDWHGAGVWRSTDLGESWQLSSEGLRYDDGGGLRLSKVSGLTAAHGRLLAGAESVGVFESRDGGVSWSLLSTLDGQPGRERWNDPAGQPPGHLGLPAILPHPQEPERFWAVVQGVGIFETADGGSSWTPRNRGLRAGWPLENPEVGYCVHKLVMSPADPGRLYQQNHCGMHRSDDTGRSWLEITEGLPSDFGFAAAAHPHDRDVLRDPARPGARAHHAGGAGGRLADPRRGLDLAAPRPGAAAAGRVPRRAAGGDGDRRARRARPLRRNEHRAGLRERRRGRDLDGDRELPARDRVRRGRAGRIAVAEVHLPATLPPLHPGLPRRLELEAATVQDAIERLDERWPGLRDRLCEPGPVLRPHINVYVDRERAGLDTPLDAGSRVDVITAISGG